ncbi:MAG: TolC family protein, partial [Steroidobacteraceae bacterium]
MICSFAQPPAAWVLMMAATVCGPLHAAELAELRLNQAIERALAASPELAVTARDAEARAGALQQAGARPRPEVGVLVENVLGTGRRSGIESAESTLSLGLALERGARARRVAVAEAGVEQAELEERLKRLEVGAETARRFIVVLQGQQALTNAREGTRLFEETATAVGKRVEAARAPLAEGARAKAQLAQIRLAEEQAEHELASAQIRLAAMWGAREPDFAQVSGQLDPPPALIAFATLQQRLDGNGELARLLTEKRLREAELQLARSKARPPWHLT